MTTAAHVVKPAQARLVFRTRRSLATTVWRYPVLLLVLGPPVLRSGDRSALASVSGQFDAWVMVQVAAYVVVFIIAAARFFHASRLHHRSSLLLTLSVSLVGLLLLSAFFSSNPFSTVGFAALFGIGLFASIQTVVTTPPHKARESLIALLSAIRVITYALVALVFFFYFTKLVPVGEIGSHGYRLSGDRVARIPACAVVIFIMEAGLLIYGGSRRVLSWLGLGLAVLLIFLSQSKTGYVVVMTGLIPLWVIWFRSTPLFHVRCQRLGLTVLAVTAAAFGSVFSLNTIGAGLLTADGMQRLRTLTGRTEIAAWILHQVHIHPEGLGYVAGFRRAFLALPPEVLNGVDPQLIGSAHDSFLEILVGGGVQAFVVYMALLLATFYVGRENVRLAHRAYMTAQDRLVTTIPILLFAAVILTSFTTSEVVVPPAVDFGYFAAALAAVWLGRNAMRYAHAEATGDTS